MSEELTENIEQPVVAPVTPAPVLLTKEEFEAALADRIASLSAESEAARKTAELATADLVALQGSHDSAVTAYRALLVKSNPLFTEDQLSGNTIAELEASAQKATAFAARIQAKLEADIKSVTIPAGAPTRSGPDTSILSSREKINYAIAQSKIKQ
jgi:hypothetical protein